MDRTQGQEIPLMVIVMFLWYMRKVWNQIGMLEKRAPEWFPHNRKFRSKVLHSPTAKQIGNWEGITSSFKRAYLARGHNVHKKSLIDIYQNLLLDNYSSSEESDDLVEEVRDQTPAEKGLSPQVRG